MNSITKTWRSFWRSSGFERGILLEAAAALTATWAGLRLAGFRRWKNLLEWLTPGIFPADSVESSGLLESARTIAKIQQSAARHLFFRPNCLEQSIVLWWLLRIRGISADLRIGARKQAGRFEAHAWVEFAGTVLNDSGDAHIHFVPFDGPLSSMETQTH
jgi:Transglutaminase-like superfamily